VQKINQGIVPKRFVCNLISGRPVRGLNIPVDFVFYPFIFTDLFRLVIKKEFEFQCFLRLLFILNFLLYIKTDPNHEDNFVHIAVHLWCNYQACICRISNGGLMCFSLAKILRFWPRHLLCMCVPYLNIPHLCGLPPRLPGLINYIESVQRSFTKRLPGFHKLSSETRLKRLGLERLEVRRLHADLTMCFKIVHNLVNSPFDQFLADR